ncbi:MAG TPA: DegT/DnrJ/EryC1/StrS family aminotransferase, partial [bacterium]|nr:DegT/DnrJ/EryC1/StrS family aminotransferase [bacterium]
GAQYKNKKIGTLGDFGIYSCSSFKTLSALFGGMLISDNIEILEKIKMQAREELQKPKRLPFLVISLKILLHKFLNLPIVYSYFTFYFYSVLNSISPRLLYIIQTGNIGVLLGFKKVERYAKIKKELLFYFTDFQAELGLNNLKELNDINNKLCLIFQELKKIEGITKYFPNENSDTQNVYWRIPLFTHSQIQAMQYFLDCNIETSLSALPLCSAEECFKEFAIYDCKTAEKIYNHYLLLPTFAEMSAEQLKHLKKSLEFFLKNYEK